MLRKVQNKDEIIQRIKTPEVKEYLKKQGIKRLRLFGSFATGEQTSTSDVDFLYEESPKSKMGRELFFLMDFLKQKMGRKVDMVGKNFINHRIKKYVLSEKLSII